MTSARMAVVMTMTTTTKLLAAVVCTATLHGVCVIQESGDTPQRCTRTDPKYFMTVEGFPTLDAAVSSLALSVHGRGGNVLKLEKRKDEKRGSLYYASGYGFLCEEMP